jgi:cytochrome c biogenesis protein CcmG, thiol:disulfide interchange protein DsbE
VNSVNEPERGVPTSDASLDDFFREIPIDASDQVRSRRLRATALIATLVIVTFIVLWVASLGGDSTTDDLSVADYQAQGEVDNRLAPDFTLPSLDGPDPIHLRDFKGKLIVLNFWASWCLPCREEAPALQAAWEDYRRRGVQFLGVNERDDAAAAKAFQKEWRITYPSGFDPAGALADDYEFVGLPSTFLINPDGRIVYRFIGYLDGDVLRAALDRNLVTTGKRGSAPVSA